MLEKIFTAQTSDTLALINAPFILKREEDDSTFQALGLCVAHLHEVVSHIFESLLRDGLCLVHFGRLGLERLLELLFLERVCPLLDSRLLLARVRVRIRVRASGQWEGLVRLSVTFDSVSCS